MNTFSESSPMGKNRPIFLKEDEIGDPLKVIHQLFELYQLPELREMFDEWLPALMSSEHSAFAEGLQRSNHLFLHKNTLRVFEAIFLLFHNDFLGKAKQ